ncbi:MAG: leucine-rich repeat protein [Eubacteriales bacterium]
MLKKIHSRALLLLLLLLSFSLSLAINAYAAEITTPEGFVFETTTGTITGYSGAGGDITIPDTIDGVAVEAIGSSAFRDITLTSVVIPDSVTYIGTTAFFNTMLTTVSLSSNVEYIGNNALNTGGMTSFQLPMKSDSDFAYWADRSDNPFANGALITEFGSEYYAVYEYTVTDQDVVVVDGVINSYYYNGSGYKGVSNPQHLIVPSVLDGQTVTSTGHYSFANQNLMGVTLPDTLIVIGDQSFISNDLAEINIPYGVETINNRAFYDCELTQVNLPDTLITIGNEAFAFNNQLSNITWSSNLEEIGDRAFVYNAFETLTFPDSLLDIGEGAFSNNDLTSITFGSQLESIGMSAFYGNTLSAVTLPNSLEYIGATAFGNEVTTYTLPMKSEPDFQYWITSEGDKYPSEHVVTDVHTSHTAIYEYTFTDADVEVVDGVIISWTYDSSRYSGWGTPKHIIVPSVLDSQTITGIGNSLFDGDYISYIDLPNAIEDIGTSAFNRNLLSEIELPSSLITIGDHAFDNGRISTLTIPSNVIFIGEYAFANGKLTSVTFPEGLSTIGINAFYNNSLSTVELPSSLSVINYAVFSMNNISSLTIPNSIDTIYGNAFSNNNITVLALPNSVKYLGEQAFKGNGMTSVTLSNTLSVIGEACFNNNSLSSVDIPNSVFSIGRLAFSDNILTSFTLPTNTHEGYVTWRDSDGNTHNNGEVVSVLYLEYEAEVNYTLTDADVVVTDGTIISYDFAGAGYFLNESPTRIIIPSILDGQNITSIGEEAFRLKELEYVSLPNGVTEIGLHAFSNNSINIVELPSSLIVIGENAFSRNALTEVTLPANLEYIGYEAFRSNELTSIVIPNKVTFIGHLAFYNNIFTMFNLSTPEGAFLYWIDISDNQYAGGAEVNVANEYTAVFATAVTGVTLNLETAEIDADGTVDLNETVSPSDATNKTVAYTSSNESAATVDSSGLVTAIAEGSTTITVTTQDGGYTDTCEITIYPNVSSVELSAETLQINVGETNDLDENVLPANARNKNVTYSSDNEAVATVDSAGLVTAHSVGSAIITVTTDDSGHTDTCTVNVVRPVTGVELSHESTIIVAGQPLQLSAEVSPSDAENTNVEYSSSDESVATVDSTGLVTAVAAGTATITVTTEDGGFTDTCEVTVVSPITDQKVAIIFGMADYVGTANDLNGPVNDAIGMKAVLEYAGYTVYTYMDYTSAQLLAKVEAVATAMPTDGTLFFGYSGHGGTGTYGACLWGSDMSPIYIDDLESALSVHTGVKEVMIDACYSGGFIAKDMPASKSFSSVDTPEGFNSLVISAFSQPQLASKTLDQGGYYVMTASSGDELSYEVTVRLTDSPFAAANLVPTEVGGDEYWIGIFDYGIHDGFGLYENTEFSTLLADANADYTLTWNELFLYSEAKVNGFVDWYNANTNPDIDRQNVQVYPLNSNHVVYTPVPVTGVTIDETLHLNIGESSQLLPVVSPANATNKDVSYVSSAPEIATVDATGLVTSVSVGYATITVTTDAGGYTDTCTVQSGYPVESVTIMPETQTVEVGDTFTLTTTISPTNATNQLVVYSSSDEDVATVDAIGMVWAHSSGTATITATTDDGGFTDTCVITVITPVAGVELSYSKYSLLVNTIVQLNAQVLPADATNQAVTYSSSDESIATVDAAGLVTSHQLGTATITVTTVDGAFTAECVITVADELIESATYIVNRDRLYYEDIPIGATVQDIIDSVSHTLGDVRVFDVNMQELTGDVYVSTGYYVQLIIDGQVADELLILIKGDINPDGILDVVDYTLIRLHILDLSYLDGIKLVAADVNQDGIIDVIDYTLVRLHILDVLPLFGE